MYAKSSNIPFLLVERRQSLSTSAGDEVEEDIPSELARKIGRFLYQNLIDVAVVNSASFQEMIYSTMGHNRPDCRIPSSQPLKGKVLQAELTETEDYVQRVKQSWSKSGCSIILATWTDQQGRDLISFQVSCPQGPIYLKLSNISSFVLYLEALPLMLDKCCCGGWS